MQFESGKYYPIYNRGINRGTIFLDKIIIAFLLKKLNIICVLIALL